MLQTIRDRSQGVIVAVIVFLISLTFILWGVESYISAARRVVVAEVEGDEIGLEEFQQTLQRLRRQAEAMLGEAFDPDQWAHEDTKLKVVEQIIEARLLGKLVADARVRVSDRQVAQQLRQIPAFHDDKGFSPRLYEQRVTAFGFSALGFEQQLRDDMSKAQVRSGVEGSEFVTREEAAELAALRAQHRDIGYAVIPAAEVESRITVSDAELEKHFNAHQDDYRTPAKVAIEFIEISPAALSASVAVTPERLHEYYDANHALYTVDEQRNVNHILIEVPAGADAAAMQAAETKSKEALTRVRGSEEFEKVAREISDDVGSKAEGGETGLFPRGAMVPEFEDVAFKLAIGEISEPVRTKFGYHIIKLKEIKAGGLRAFDEVTAEVETAYRNAEAQKLFIDQAEQFSNLVYEHPDSLSVAAEGLGLQTQRAEAQTRDDIAQKFSDAVANAVFENDVLLEGLNSEPFELADGRLVAVRVAEHTPSVVPPLAEVKAKVEEAVRVERRRNLTAELGQQMLERLRAGETVNDVVQDQGFGWEQVAGADRDSDKVNRAVLRAAFSTHVPDAQPFYTGTAIGVSDYAIIRIANVATPPTGEVAKDEIDKTRRELVVPRGNATWREFVAALRAASTVEIYAKNL